MSLSKWDGVVGDDEKEPWVVLFLLGMYTTPCFVVTSFKRCDMRVTQAWTLRLWGTLRLACILDRLRITLEHRNVVEGASSHCLQKEIHHLNVMLPMTSHYCSIMSALLFGSASLAVRAFERPCLHFPEGFMTHSANARASRCANVEMGFWWLNVPPTIIA